MVWLGWVGFLLSNLVLGVEWGLTWCTVVGECCVLGLSEGASGGEVR